MDQLQTEVAKELTKGSMEVAKKFATSLIGRPLEELGGILTDTIQGYRLTNQARVLLKTKADIESLGIDPINFIPDFFLPLMNACSYIENSELSNMYSKLLTTHLNQTTTEQAHTAFIDIIKGMSPYDAYVFQKFYTYQKMMVRNNTIEYEFFSSCNATCDFQQENFGMLIHLELCDNSKTSDRLEMSIFNLNRLGLLTTISEYNLINTLTQCTSSSEFLSFADNIDILKKYKGIDLSEDSLTSLKSNIASDKSYYSASLSPWGISFAKNCMP